MFKSAFCTHWEQKHCPAGSSQRELRTKQGDAMFVYIHDTEMGRPDCRARLEAMNRWTITAYWWKAQWKVLTEHEKENPPYWQLSTKLKILEYLPTLTACFTTFYHPIFHARVSWTCWVLLILCCENLSTTRRAKSTVSPTGYYKLMACIVESGTGMLDSSTGHAEWCIQVGLCYDYGNSTKVKVGLWLM